MREYLVTRNYQYVDMFITTSDRQAKKFLKAVHKAKPGKVWKLWKKA